MVITDFGVAILEHDTHMSKWVLEHKRLDFDQNVLPFLLEYIKEGDTCIDIGANIGCYAYAFLNKVGEKGFVYCFEPSIESYECLKHNLYNFDNNSFIFNYGLGCQESRAYVVRENDNVGMNFCMPNNDGDVVVKTLDSLFDIKIDFIKIDVEGMELDVLIVANDIIEKYKPNLFIEINEATLKRKSVIPLDIFNWLTKKGYTFKNIYPNEKMKGSQYDIICIHNEKV